MTREVCKTHWSLRWRRASLPSDLGAKGLLIDDVQKIPRAWHAVRQAWGHCAVGRMLSPTAHAYLSLMDSAVTKFKKRIRSIQERDAELWESELKRLGVVEESDPASAAK